MRPRTRTLALVALLIVPAVLGSCDGRPDSPGPITSTSPSTVLPQTPPPYTPNEPLTVGAATDLPGFAQLIPPRNIRAGFDIDLTLWLAENVNPKFRPVFTDLTIEERDPAMQDRTARLITEVYSITDQRRQFVTFVGPYMLTKQSVMVRAGDDRFRTVDDLTRRRVCTLIGSTSFMRLAPISDPAFVIPVPASQECVDLLKTKQVDAVTLDELVLQGFAERDPDLAVLPDVSFGEDERYGIGLPKGDIQLCEILTRWLRKLFTEGQWEVFFRNNFPNLDPERERFKPPAPYRFDRCT